MRLTFEHYVQTGNDGYPVQGEGLKAEWNDIRVEWENTDPRPAENVWFVLTTLANVADLRTSDRRSVAVWAAVFDRASFPTRVWPESGATTVEYAETCFLPLTSVVMSKSVPVCRCPLVRRSFSHIQSVGSRLIIAHAPCFRVSSGNE